MVIRRWLTILGLLAVFVNGFLCSHYITYKSAVAGSNLILFNLLHIHHWTWSSPLTPLFLADFLSPKWNRLIRFLIVVIILAIGLGHQIQGHILAARWFFLSAVMISSAYVNWPNRPKRIISLILGLTTLGIFSEGIYSGLYEWLNHDNLSAFQIILPK